MMGQNTFFPLWIAGLAFFAVNIGILAVFMRHHSYAPLFHKGALVQLVPSVSLKQE